MRTIKAKWDSFEAKVLPKDCSEVQREEMRRAFYAGAAALLALNDEIAAFDTEAKGIALLSALYEEAEAFAMNLRATTRGPTH